METLHPSLHRYRRWGWWYLYVLCLRLRLFRLIGRVNGFFGETAFLWLQSQTISPQALLDANEREERLWVRYLVTHDLLTNWQQWRAEQDQTITPTDPPRKE